MSYNELKQHGSTDFPIELYRLDTSSPKYEMAYHWHSNIELIRVINGKLNLSLDDRKYILTKNDIAIANSETVHGALPESCAYECIVFSPNLLETKINECETFLFGIKKRIITIDEYFEAKENEFSAAVNELFYNMSEKNVSKFKVVGSLHKLFGIIYDKNLYKLFDGIKADKNITRLKDVLKYMQDCYDTPVTLENMAETAGMSAKYFCRFFKAMTNKTPMEYMMNIRIENAANKLIKSSASVTEIAYSCGFNDLSYFIKQFKFIKGVTPREYRKNQS